MKANRSPVFTRGFALAFSELYRAVGKGNDEDFQRVLHEAGFYDPHEFIEAGVDSYDLAPITGVLGSTFKSSPPPLAWSGVRINGAWKERNHGPAVRRGKTVRPSPR